MKLVVGISGASGAPYARRLLDFLAAHGKAHGVSVDLVFTPTGRQVWKHEIGSDPRYPWPVWKSQDFTAPFASGSALYDAMVVIPCSAGALSRIAYGLSLDLLGRAADVMLKERRRLVLVLRETPHLAGARAGHGPGHRGRGAGAARLALASTPGPATWTPWWTRWCPGCSTSSACPTSS